MSEKSQKISKCYLILYMWTKAKMIIKYETLIGYVVKYVL